MARALREPAAGAARDAAGPREAASSATAATATRAAAAPASELARRRARRRRRRGDGARQGDPHARPPRRAPRSARLRAARRPGARAGAPRPEAHARAAGAHPRRRSSACTFPARRSPTRCRTCARRTAARSRTRSSTSPTTRSASGCARRSSPAATGSRSPTTSAKRSSRGSAAVEGIERYLRRAFLGQKQFSIEGLDVMVPMLDEAIELAADAGAHEVVIGMAHRGRLNVLAHVVGRPYETILREFEGERTIEAVVSSEEGGTGDVKYHLGAVGTRRTARGRDHRHARGEPEPPRGRRPGRRGTGARGADRPLGARRLPRPDDRAADPHPRRRVVRRPGRGRRDAQPRRLAGYSTGGTLHLIANNQVGFTTDPDDGRSTRYSSDLAKGFDIPIIHVNADDPEACDRRRPSGDRVPLALRARRRRRPRRLPPLRPQRAGRAGVHAAADGRGDRGAPDRARAVRGAARRARASSRRSRPTSSTRRSRRELKAAHEQLKQTFGAARSRARTSRCRRRRRVAVDTAVAAGRLRALNEQLLRVPDGSRCTRSS